MKINSFFITILLFIPEITFSQEIPAQWDLQNCISYALRNNIQIKQSMLDLKADVINTKQAKAQLWPDLSASVNQNLSNAPFIPSNTYSGSYGISSSMTLFDGGKNIRNIEQMKLSEQSGSYAVLQTEKNIRISILQTYLRILYADETVKVNEATLEVSEYQKNRGQELLKAGSISQADLAQLESQYSSDKYQLKTSENTLRSYKLELKQLLELPVNESMNILIPELDSLEILAPLPELTSIYYNALEIMPQIKSSRIEVEIASLDTRKAKAGYYPKVSLNANIGTSNNSSSSYSMSEQLQKGLTNAIGLSVSIPILSQRENKSSVQKAQLNEESSRLNLLNTEKELLKDIESIYQDATASQSQYIAALEKVKALRISYTLVEQQYNLGIKNTLDLLTEKNNLINAEQNAIQAKYLSVMNIQLLNIYQDLPLGIE